MNIKSENQPLVSIIMNCYNSETYLYESINSVLSQTYQNWELIFWDNQSSDLSKKIFNNFKDKRLNYYYANEHTTLYCARNLAINKSKGEYIAFLDADDWWDNKKLEKQMSKFTRDDVGLVFSNLYYYYQKNRKKKIFSKEKLYTGFVRKNIIKNYKIGINSTIIRKKAYESEPKGFDAKYNIIGDYDFFARLSKLWSFECVQEPLAYYRIHEKNFSHQNLNLEIEELEHLHNKYTGNNFITSSESEYLLSNINYLKCKKLIFDKKRLKALLNFFSIKNYSFKLKLLIRIFVPNFLIKWSQKHVGNHVFY